MIDTAIVLAGGLGTRLRGVIADRPKPMAEVAGRPFLEYVLHYLAQYGIRKSILSVGYKADMIEAHFGNSYGNMHLSYAIEEVPLGTGGGIVQATRQCEVDTFFVVNGDTLFEADLHQLRQFYVANQAAVALSLKSMTAFSRYGVVQRNGENRIIAFEEKGYRDDGFINGGVYLLSQSALDTVGPLPERFSFERDFLERYVNELPMYGCALSGYFIDIGIPDDYQRAQHELKDKL